MHREVARGVLAAWLTTALLVPELAASELRVAVRVAPARPAPAALENLPLPPATRPLTAQAFTRSFQHDGPAKGAADYFRSALPTRGYRLVSARGDGTLVWESATVRLELALQPVLGRTPVTRIVAQASRRAPDH